MASASASMMTIQPRKKAIKLSRLQYNFFYALIFP